MSRRGDPPQVPASGPPRYRQSLNNLGMVQYALREYAAAKQSHEQALAICRKSLPPDHPDIATSLNNLGLRAVTSCGSMRRPSRAMSRRWRSVRKSLPPDHPDIATKSEQPGDGAVRVAGVCGGQAEP